MLQKLSYLNLIFAVIYLLVYLRSGTWNTTLGIAAVIVFNWLAIRSYHLDDYHWGIWHILTACWSLYFVGFILYGAFNLLLVALEVDYFGTDTLTNVAIGLCFSSSVVSHFIGYWKRRL